jgi:photosystem II stability/assembly factor-like uncharacterized protein
MRRLGVTLIPALTLLTALAAATPATSAVEHRGATRLAPFDAGWTEQVLDADQNFRGLEAVSKKEAWVTGESLTDGGPATVFRTTDRGKTWTDVSPDDTAGLSFRDVEVNGKVAHVLAIGPGEASRIYRSTDGGATWTIAFQNDDPDAFYDCMAFYPGGQKGLAVSDPVDGKLRILSTRDRGRTWTVLSDAGMPASADEFGFAASGDCLVTAGKAAFLITGGARSCARTTAASPGPPSSPASRRVRPRVASPARSPHRVAGSPWAATSARTRTCRTTSPTPATAAPGPTASP